MILVTGATGHIGRAVVSDLALRGREVVAMVRDSRAAAGLMPPGIALRVADYEDVSSLGRALAGIDEMVLISSDGDAKTVMRHHANVIETAGAARLRHITFTSIVDTDASSPFYFAPVYRDAEQRLAACGVPSTIVRCGLYCDFILDHWLQPSHASGELVLPAGQGQIALVSRDDVAAAVTAVAARPDVSGDLCTITGRQASSFGDIAAAYAEAVGGPMHYRPCSITEYMQWASARLDDPWPQAFASLCTSIAEGRYNQVSGDFTALTGREPESFRDFLGRTTSAIA
ncbi:NAD(P)H-binding protein [Mesorhizobium sp. PAMC28654]|uniref:NAD(P)H-binding protein n=1 Tax=Mesorhizobium sp. PAMC28654 TaxID=2880934 RepID=UPI001D09A402|nr:NAD(P)H-binding protein [Mesorhizobium sp. PAMC28654]UDL89281.1 NAD(P)H-binding protein [Mesorhizobium sp. PAMC28654]